MNELQGGGGKSSPDRYLENITSCWEHPLFWGLPEVSRGEYEAWFSRLSAVRVPQALGKGFQLNGAAGSLQPCRAMGAVSGPKMLRGPCEKRTKTRCRSIDKRRDWVRSRSMWGGHGTERRKRATRKSKDSQKLATAAIKRRKEHAESSPVKPASGGRRSAQKV